MGGGATISLVYKAPTRSVLVQSLSSLWPRITSVTMQVISGLLLALVGAVAAGGLTAWPGLPALRTQIIPSTRGFAYSTTQYINSLPTSYSLGYTPQALLQPSPAFNYLSGFQSPYYPFAAASYFPQAAGAIYYPPPAPILSQENIPIATSPSFPQQPPAQIQGDQDTTIIDSANQEQSPQPTQPIPQNPSPAPNPSQPQFPSMPNPAFPPSFPQIPGFPSLPQLPEGSQPSFPTIPQFPTNPPFTQSPASQPFPSADREEKGLNDEDTISVESA